MSTEKTGIKKGYQLSRTKRMGGRTRWERCNKRTEDVMNKMLT